MDSLARWEDTNLLMLVIQDQERQAQELLASRKEWVRWVWGQHQLNNLCRLLGQCP